MSFMDWPIEPEGRERRGHKRRRKIALRLIDAFARVFPAIKYTLIWDSRIINAQAWLGEARNVYLYGALVRHPAITRAGLALTLAHETGHHLGGPPRDPAMRWMTWQGQADYWAARVGMPAVFGDAAAQITARGAREIVALQRRLHVSDCGIGDLAPETRLAIFDAGRRGEIFPRNAIGGRDEQFDGKRELDHGSPDQHCGNANPATLF